ncbi:hypothetical protein RvY_01448 [Ramazzottius varieornatus]|uniref:Dehydrogenase/reductase SDR family member 1 n=1 Tax=Ramazzottius varieornatus TaxID=947166 RepID=A0A1D1UGC3_RAMVA|nr:hypothetical protein RvY_01448 [Ramazzottius varieornatus]
MTSPTRPLSNKVVLVTGASRGLGKGIALQLGEAGCTVYITGRTLDPTDAPRRPGSLRATAEEINARGGKAVPVQCDHSKDEDIARVFEMIASDEGRLDLLVNNAYSAVNALVTGFGKPFWEIPETMWDEVNNVGLRNHYICSAKAAQIMTKKKSGLIVNVSSLGGKVYLFTPAYGIGKVACDRMAADCGLELKSHNVAFVSLWPGAVKTELIMQGAEARKSGKVEAPTGETAKIGANAHIFEAFGNGESPEFSGKCIVALMQDKGLMEKTGKVLTTAALGKEFGLKDIDGRTIEEQT